MVVVLDPLAFPIAVSERLTGEGEDGALGVGVSKYSERQVPGSLLNAEV